MAEKRTVLITGCSSGFGLLASVAAARAGFRVVSTMRDTVKKQRLIEAAASAGVADGIEVVQLDVTDPSSVARCAADVHERHGPLHALVNNAGIGIGGFFEDLTAEEIRSNMETNFFGVLDVTRAFLAPMREAGRGRIVNVSSVAGRIANAGMSSYISTKFALEGFSEALWHEVRRFGIHVVLVEPGMFRTEIFESNLRLCKGAENADSPYHELSRKLKANVMKQYEARAAPAGVVADVIVEALTAPRPRLRYPVGKDARIGILLRWLLPERWFLRMVSAATR